MKKVVKGFIYSFLLILGFLIISVTVFYVKKSIAKINNYKLLGKEAPLLVKNRYAYRDLNKNGELDVYEDKNQSIDKRIDDLISQMTIEEKAGSMFINMIGVNKDGTLMEIPSFSDPFSFLMGSTSEMVLIKKMNHFNIRASHSKENMLKWYNSIQKMGEQTRLGIPITIASDPRHGVKNEFGASIYTPYFSKWPSALGLGAIGDSLLVKEYGDIVRQEYKAIGIKMALGPMADIATEPRWTRINGTFGENAETNAKLTAAYIRGIQGDTIGKHSVAAMVKHFPGSGAVDGGKDTHFPPGYQSYKGNNFEYHLIPFEAAFEVGVSSVMPFYSIAKGITTEDVGAAFNKEIITSLLRERYNFDGIICSDWALITDTKLLGILFKPASAHGVEHLNSEERLEKILKAGVDLIGGESLSISLSKLIKSDVISEERINESLRRIMREKFRLGLFDKPYLEEKDLAVFNNSKSIAKGIEAQKRSLVLLKNENNILPLNQKTKIYLHGFSSSINSKINIASLKDADVIIAKLTTPEGEAIEAKSIMEKLFGGGRLDYSSEVLEELIPLFKSKPTIIVATIQRPIILTEIEEVSKAMIANFDVADDLILKLIFGDFSPTGKLPLQMPSSMKSVLEQNEDVPFDSKNALFEYGHGLTYD
ncbi:MAG: glycoside hydrolase family 3 N-terminal domain-containing protein [Bacteroidota bacterium]|nr:glycoside hydrolase family 3 N-terminal domain-containing protein [Bacteroidota bacterium]